MASMEDLSEKTPLSANNARDGDSPGGGGASPPSPDSSLHSANGGPSLSPSPSRRELHSSPRLTLLPLIALIFFEVSGGPYGAEEAVKDGGPLLAILGFTLFPLVWCIPEAMMTAELCTAFPENSGFVVWVSSAFGPFWGFQVGLYQWLSGVIDNSLYPILFLDYLKHQVPLFACPSARVPALILITIGLTYWNYRGLVIVGVGAVLLTVFGILPFVALCVLSVPKIRPSRWLQVDLGKVHWRGFLNNLFWNLNSWDSVSTLAGEVEEPCRTFPRAVVSSLTLVVLVYLLPLLAGTGAVGVSSSDWSDGFFSELGVSVGGQWLGTWITVAAALSTWGQFEAEMSSDAYQLLGMAERGMIPKLFMKRSEYGTPLVPILCSASGIVLFAWMTFDEIVEMMNFLYCFGMILEIGAFVALRFSHPLLPRPYRVPVGQVGAVVLAVPPLLVLVTIISLASSQTLIVSVLAALLGFLLYPVLMVVKHRGLLDFVNTPLSQIPSPSHQEPLF